jgi:cation:H+ antiporter
MLFIWIIVFIVSLAVLLKGADWFLHSAEKIGATVGLSPFIIGVTIVAFGTSFPELFASFAAIFAGKTEIVVANAVGSNIANILLIVGISAIVAKKLVVTKDLIDIDLPLLALAMAVGFLAVADKVVTMPEAVLLLASYIVYVLYTIFHKDDKDVKSKAEKLLSHKSHFGHSPRISAKNRLTVKDGFLLFIGIGGLILGSQYLIKSVVAISDLLSIGAGVVAITAVALGTSLPELIVSIKAAFRGKSEIALGNIFGSNIFNMLVVVGVPGLFARLTLDEETFAIGLPFMMIATILFVLSGISKRIHIWEGALYLVIYIFFIGKLFTLL